LHRRESVERDCSVASETLCVHAVVATPPLVEHRLDTRQHPQSRKDGACVHVHHLDVLEPMVRRSDHVVADKRSCLGETGDHDVHGTVTDHVVPGLDALDRAGRDVVTNFGCRRV